MIIGRVNRFPTFINGHSPCYIKELWNNPLNEGLTTNVCHCKVRQYFIYMVACVNRLLGVERVSSFTLGCGKPPVEKMKPMNGK